MQGYHFQTLLILITNVCNGLSATILSPFVDSIVMFYGKSDSRNSTGYYSGALLASVMLGRVLFSPFWGWASDRFGRKPCVLVNLLAFSLFSFGFAIAPNYWAALACRFCLGCFSCISICMRSSVTELTPKEYHPQASMLFTTGYNLGQISGASIGGFFVNVTFGLAFLEEYPYALPSLVCSALSLVVFVIVKLFFKESLNPGENKPTHSSTWGAYKSLMQNPAILSYCYLMLLTCLLTWIVASVYPTWCFADKEHGGMHLSPNDLGILLTISSVSAIILQNVFYKPLVAKFGLIGTVKASAWILIPLFALMPFTALLGPLRIPALVVGQLVNNICNFQITTALLLIAAEAVEKVNSGKLNALLMIFNNSARMIAPALGGSVFAWSLSVNSFPIDYHLVFFLTSLFAFGLVRLANVVSSHHSLKQEPLLSSSIEMPKT
jgi:MFS family permease